MTRIRCVALLLSLAVVGGGAYYFFRDVPVAATAPAPQPATAPIPAEPREDSSPADNAKPVEPQKLDAAKGPDPFEFIRALAKSAYDGDGRAQYLISRELDRCEMTLSLVRKHVGDPESHIWSLPETGWTQPMKESTIAELRRCIRLLKEDPFADLPPRKEGYSFQYWRNRAVEAGYPQAVVDKSLRDWSLQTEGGTHAQKAGAESLGKLANAVVSGDPEIALTIGFRQSMYEDPSRKTSASAWMLAACRLGADCSANSKVVPFWMCYDPNYPNCSVDGNVELMVSSALSPADYGDAYSQSQVIEEALRSRDPDAIRKLLEKLL
jgi:hypothetical protein